MRIYYIYVMPGGSEHVGNQNLDSNNWTIRWVTEFLQDKHPNATIKSITVEI